MLGILKVITGLLFGGTLLALLYAYPMAILGPMLVFAGVELAKFAKDIKNFEPIVLLLITAITIIISNTITGCIVGFMLYGTIQFIKWIKANLTPIRNAL